MTFIIDGTAGATFPNGSNPQAAIAAKASALAKLTALGLTQAEVTALLG